MKSITIKHNLHAMILVLIMPFICWLILGYKPSSISDIYNSNCIPLFVAMLTYAGSVFIRDSQDITSRKYNLIFGVSLIMIGITQHTHVWIKYPHFFFASVFYLGHAIVIPWLSIPSERWWKLLISVFGIIAPITLGVLTNRGVINSQINLFDGENISNLFITSHYYLEMTNKTS